MRTNKLPDSLRSVVACPSSPSWIAAFAIIVIGAAQGHAALVSFAAEIDGTERVATVEETVDEGVSRVSIMSIAAQFGGGVSLLPTRVRVDLAGSTAWLQADDNRVNAFRVFSLMQPTRRTDNDFLIATTDVPTFFEKAFRVTVFRQSPNEVIATPVTTTAPGAMPPDSPNSSQQPAQSTNIQVIAIDPGHGGFETGVEGGGGLTEKALSLDVALRLKQALEQHVSQKIVLTRENDLALNEAQRAAIVQNSAADVLVTLHAGSSLSPRVRGSMVLYESGNARVHGQRTKSRDDARRLAMMIAESLKAATAIPLRGVDTAETRSMAHAGTAGVMIELGCLTNSEDEAELNAEETRASIASAISNGMLEFLGITSPAPEEARSEAAR